MSPITTEKLLSVKAVVTLKESPGGLLSKIGIKGGVDLLLELVSAELDPSKY